MTKKIAIIGGGTMALYLLKSFVDTIQNNMTLDIFESSESVGMGMPYSHLWANLEHKVNIASKELPKALEEPHIWLSCQSDALLEKFGIVRDEISPNLVFPRILFGKYQENQFFALLQKAYKKGLRITVHTSTLIQDIVYIQKTEKVKLTTSSNSFEFDSVVLATGHRWPKEKENNIPGYFDSPFPLSKLGRRFNHTIGLLGSSLSAVDAIRTLARSNGEFYKTKNGKLQYKKAVRSNNFRIIMHSRRGLLPSIRYYLEHPRIKKYEYISKKEILNNISQNKGYLSLDYVFETSYKKGISQKDPTTYSQIKDMTVEQFANYYYDRVGIESSNPFREFKKQLNNSKESEKNKSPIFWREAIEDTYYTLNFHAKSLSAEDMIRLRKYLMPLYYHAVIFMPFDSAEELLALHDAEVLDIIPLGYDSSIKTIKNRGTIVLYENNKKSYKTFIDCRGQKELSFQSFPFKTLIKQGLVSPAKVRFVSKEEAVRVRNDVLNTFLVEKTNNDYFVRLPGVSFNDRFQAIDNQGNANSRIHILANAYIKGFNPDLSGIPFCKDAAQIVMESISETRELLKEGN